MKTDINTRLQEAAWAAARIGTINALKSEMIAREISLVHLSAAIPLMRQAQGPARRDSGKKHRILAR